MRFPSVISTGLAIAAACFAAQGQTPPAADPQAEFRGVPPRAAPTDYIAHAQAGKVTIAAEFKGHSIPTPQGLLAAEEYVAVEVGLFGPAGAHVNITGADFSLRINGRRSPLPAQASTIVGANSQDPEWVPPESAESKEGSKTKLNAGGGGGAGGEKPPPPKPPFPLKRSWSQRVQKTGLLEGDRVLPQAGLIFFQYRGKTESIHSVELVYSGAAGNATLELQP